MFLLAAALAAIGIFLMKKAEWSSAMAECA